MSILPPAQYWVHGKRKIGRPKGEASNIIPRPKKKRGRKRLFASAKVETECEAVREESNKESADVIQAPNSIGKYFHCWQRKIT